jgi:DNA-binding LacI/PurR family transcriptional regulator
VCLFELPLNASMTLRLAQAPGPVVLADWHDADAMISSVTFDNRRVGLMAAEHLLSLGHRHVACLGYDDGHPLLGCQKDRWMGLEAELRAAGASASLVRGEDDNAIVAAFGERLRGPQAPTAAVLLFPSIAPSLVGWLDRLGLRVPEQVSIIGFGRHRHYLDRGFTEIQMDEASMAEEVLHAFLDENLRTHPRHILVGARLIDRGSTAPPPGTPESPR